jgi:3-deoxy-D-manno-octulosonic-acid transferase
MEAELWYMLFVVAKARGAKTYLINARINTRSYHKYLRFRWFYTQIFKHIDVVLAQSNEDKTRLESLGATNVKVAGNIKLATHIAPTQNYDKPHALTLTAGSTHEGEERVILEAFHALEESDKKLLIVPRHPERFESVSQEVETFAQAHGYSASRFSQNKHLDTQIVVIDVMGELINLYAISDIVILGGGFNPKGGHNPLEPATFGVKLISGDQIFNQKALFELVENYQLCDDTSLTETLKNHKEIQPSSINGELDLEVYNEALKEFITPLSKK